MSQIQAYIETDKWLHWLSQLIAKVNRTYVSPREDDSHTNIGFDRMGKRLCSRWITGSEGRLILTMELTNKMFRFNWLDESRAVVISHELGGRTREAIEFDIDGVLEQLGFDPEGYTDALHFEIPDYGFRGVAVPRKMEGLPKWRNFRGLANSVCNELLEYFQKGPYPRIWPHHFDTGIHVDVNEHLDIAFGLAMADEMVEIPYFYMSGIPENNDLDFTELPLLGHGEWHLSDEWKGAVWPMSEQFLSIDNPRETIRHFARVAADWYLHAV